MIESIFQWDIGSTRNLLHLLGVIVWIGGQIIVGALMPVVRKLGEDAPLRVAKQFNRVAWPAFGFAILTGLWNMGEAWEDATTNWKIVLFVKVGIVALTGITAYEHTRVQNKGTRAFFAASTLILSITVLILGVGLGGERTV